MCPLNWKLKQYHNMRSAGVRPGGKRVSWDAKSEPPPLHAVPVSLPLTIHAKNSPLSPRLHPSSIDPCNQSPKTLWVHDSRTVISLKEST